MEASSTILSDVKKIRELSDLAENITKNFQKLEKEHTSKIETAERLSMERIEKQKKESLKMIKEAEEQLKTKLESIESARNEFESTRKEFESIRNEVLRCAHAAKDKIRLNVGGMLFVATRETLLSVEETLFCHLLGSYIFFFPFFIRFKISWTSSSLTVLLSF